MSSTNTPTTPAPSAPPASSTPPTLNAFNGVSGTAGGRPNHISSNKKSTNNGKKNNSNVNTLMQLLNLHSSNINKNKLDPNINHNFNILLSKLKETYKDFGLPQAPTSVMEPAFGKDSINAITDLYDTYYIPTINKLSVSGSVDDNTINLFRLFGLMQVITFRSLSMVDMYSLLRTKYGDLRFERAVNKMYDILKGLNTNGIKTQSAKDMVNILQKTIENLVPKKQSLALATLTNKAVSGGGGKKNKNSRSKKSTNSVAKKKKVIKSAKKAKPSKKAKLTKCKVRKSK